MSATIEELARQWGAVNYKRGEIHDGWSYEQGMRKGLEIAKQVCQACRLPRVHSEADTIYIGINNILEGKADVPGGEG